MFFEQFDQYMSDLSKFFRTKRNNYETAALFDQLARTQDSSNPFECALAGLAKFGELQCYLKIEDKSRTVQAAIHAARLFIKNAKYGYDYSRIVKETWSISLADGLHCYRVAIDVLKTISKHYLTSIVLIEMGKVEMSFDFPHHAGNTFEEAVGIIIEGQVPLPVLFDSVLNTVQAYTRVDRFDLALNVVEKAHSHFFDNETMWVSPSPIMKKQYRDILIYQAQLLIMVFRYEDCLKFVSQNHDTEIAELFRRMVEASKNYQIFVIDSIIQKALQSKQFNAQQIALFNRHLALISKNVEAGVFQVMS